MPDATLPARVSQISASTSSSECQRPKLEELRRLPANRDQTDNQLLGSLAGKVITVLYPEPGAAFAVGCERYYLESAIPIELKERPEGTKIDELTFWSI